jgi:hypothetical protein
VLSCGEFRDVNCASLCFSHFVDRKEGKTQSGSEKVEENCLGREGGFLMEFLVGFDKWMSGFEDFEKESKPKLEVQVELSRFTKKFGIFLMLLTTRQGTQSKQRILHSIHSQK